ncbi:MAG TPA: peptidylprolyl isomerase [Stellaceae bacterium]|nr:peptidylprolyl isomerase [Stellaceae bacterium]
MIMTARRAMFACLILALASGPALAQSKPPAAAPAPSGGDPVVARVNGEVLHRSDAIIAYQALSAETRQNFTLEQAYPQVIDQLVSMIVISQAARKAGVGADPIVKRRVTLADDQILQDAYFNSILQKEISKDKIQAAYDQYAKEAPGREEINARHILVSSEADANDVIAQLKKGADFATLAKQKTVDPAGKTSGGDLGWFGQGDLDPGFTAAAFKLKKGEYTQTPVHTQYGWHVIMVVDRRPMKVLPYEQMAPKIAQQMAQAVVGARVKELDTQAKVEIFTLDGGKLPAAGGSPQAGPAPKPSGAPKLTPPAQNPASAPGAPTLSPATAPNQINKP